MVGMLKELLSRDYKTVVQQLVDMQIVSLCLSVLAQRGYFKDKAFVNYLKYLLYWKEPEYAKYLK